MYYSFILFYLLTCWLYFCTLQLVYSVVKKIHQNATSKNRTSIKEIKDSISSRKKAALCLLWPFYEAYLFINKNE